MPLFLSRLLVLCLLLGGVSVGKDRFSSTRFMELLLAPSRPQSPLPAEETEEQAAPQLTRRERRELERQEKAAAREREKLLRHVKTMAVQVARSDANVQDQHGKTLLMYAVQFPNAKAVEYLTEFQPDLRIRDKEGHTVFDYEREGGNGGIRPYAGKLLYNCLRCRDYEEYRAWRRLGAEPNAQLCGAIIFEQTLRDGAFDCFVDIYKGAQLEDVPTQAGIYLSEILLTYGDKAAIEVGVDALGLSVWSVPADSTKFPSLFLLMQRGEEMAVKLYAAQNIVGDETLRMAVRHSTPEEVAWMLSQYKGKALNSMVFEAARRGNLKVLETVADGGADMNALNERGETVLMHAALSGDVGVVQKVLEKLSEERRTAVDSVGRSAVYYARWACSREVEQLLLENGVQESEKDKL